MFHWLCNRHGINPFDCASLACIIPYSFVQQDEKLISVCWKIIRITNYEIAVVIISKRAA